MNLVDQLLKKIENRTANCAVLGLGMVGAMQSCLLSEARYRVAGYGIDTDVLRARSAEFAKWIEPRWH